MCLCYFLFPCALFQSKHGHRHKEKKKKIAHGLALAVMLMSACFHDMGCFTCTYAYVRACIASENKAFMLLPLPGFYASLRIMLAPFM